MGIERSLIILKPDALKGGLEFEIMNRFRRKGFSIEGLYKTRPSEALLRQHYAEVIADKGEDIGRKIIDYMMSGPVLVAIIEGNDAVQSVRNMSGSKTAPIACAPGTIRHDYSTDSFDFANEEGRSVENMIHSSDSTASADREIDMWFNQNAQSITRLEPDCLDDIAEAIGYEWIGLVEGIIADSNMKGLLYHGVKNRDSIPKIEKQGLKPLTPESGLASFWATGLSLFYPLMDSPFFRYSGEHSPNHPELCELNLAVSSYKGLALKGHSLPTYQFDTQLLIKETIPYDSLAIINIKVEHPVTEDTKTLRGYAKKAEQMLLRAIDSQLTGQFTPGNTIRYHKRIKE
jgi:nucleoside-diphosphate kinase